MSLFLERSVGAGAGADRLPARDGSAAPRPRVDVDVSLSLARAATAAAQSYLPLDEDDSLDMVLFDVLREASAAASTDVETKHTSPYHIQANSIVQ
uniref:Uncharacterized protein n=1 Tax=Leersia perrieri TaxID=77586 RepID=A0A0D9V5Q8_9ORYZ